MSKKKIAICYFTNYSELKFLNESLRCLKSTINRHPEYEIKTFIFDDENSGSKINEDELIYPVDIITTKFKRTIDFGGYEALKGVFKSLKDLQLVFSYDYIVRLDSMTCLNCLDSIFMIEDEIVNSSKIPAPLGYFSNYVLNSYPCPYWQNYNKIAIDIIDDICNFANTERGETLKKQLERGYPECVVVSNMLQKMPLYVVDTNNIFNLKGCCNPFIKIEENYLEYSAVSFRCEPNARNYVIAYNEMKKHVDSII